MTNKRNLTQIESVGSNIEIHEKCKVYLKESDAQQESQPSPIFANIIKEKSSSVLSVNLNSNEIATIAQDNSDSDLQADECNNPNYLITLNMSNIINDTRKLSKDKKKKVQNKIVKNILQSVDTSSCDFYKFNYSSDSDNLLKKFDQPIKIDESLYQIYQNCLLKEMEFEFKNNSNKDYSSQLTILYRNELIRYLHLLAKELSVCNRTLELAIVIFDRYYDICESFKFQIIQLIGATCLLIACKYDGEFQCPTIAELNYSSNNQFTKKDFILMEREILSTLNYHIPNITSWDFADIFLLVALEPYKRSKNYMEIKNHFYNLVNNILSTSHFSFDLRRCSKSSLACAAICIARSLIGIRPLWKRSLIQISNYSINDFYFEYHLLSKLYKQNYQHLTDITLPPNITLEILLSDLDY